MSSPILSASALSLALVVLASAAAGQDRIHVQPVFPAFEGASLAALGDVDSDGFADLAVGLGGLGLSARVISGFSGKALFTTPDLGSITTTGQPMADASDIDGDGADDLVLGFIGSPSQAVVLVSGRTGAFLLTIPQPRELDGVPSSFAFAVGGADDLDGDGHGDLLVGAPGLHLSFGGQSFVSSGRTYAFSGATGAELFHVDSPLPSIGFGSALDRLGDVNGDAVPDFIVGASRHAFVISGSDGERLHAFASGANDGFGLAVTGCDDLDGDAVPDLAVGGSGAEPEFIEGPGFVVVFSGATGRQLWRVDGAGLESLGKSISLLPDADGDGVDDLVAGAPGPFFPMTAGKVLGLSGRDGSTLFTVHSGPDDVRFGFFVAGLSDVNGDARPDFALTTLMGEAMRLDIDSTVDLALVTDTDSIALSQGGSQALSLQVGSAAGGRAYRLLGSISGVTPGFAFKGHVVPLNLDPYTLFTIANPGVIAGGLGVLDAGGGAAAQLNVPPLALPALVGLTLEHAAIVWEGSPGGPVHAVTNAATLRFDP